ncbi:hypothetical protein Glove_306g67 [Diversispora epigaea]|uniref:BTB domain-containing protein n=1 Tax=Diversispora epigaea TaxID=1348612 RepID=A0A397HZM4_9GLOM|nr:hypothetical protein Glove_306g67 [Diversispora epigaea]
MALKFFDKLSQNFTKLLNEKDDYNVIIEVEDKKQFTAHSNIFKCRSPYFCKELDTINPSENNIKTIVKPDISAQVLDIILKYIYGELSKKLEIILIEDKASWLKSHFSLVYRTIFINNNFKDLENFCNNIVVKYPSLIFDAEDFTSLQEAALISLLKRDDLQVEEAKIWEYVIKWGIAQNPTLPANLDEWNKDNFLTLKTTLQHCLPYIRYFHISGDDILKKVEPYKKILDKQLWKDLFQHFLSPNQPKKSVVLPARTILIPELPNHFTSLQEAALISLLKRDDLQVEEAKIWEYVIKWGIAQNPTLPANLDEWNKDNFLTLKTTLQHCLPYIRYFHISGDDILKKVEPYKKILDKQLWKDLFQHFLSPNQPKKSVVLPARTILIPELPNRFKELFSTIISDDHAAEISSRIDHKNSIYPSVNYPHKFQLILRGSKDGFAPRTF